jgi:2-methylcitrate dehydratase PrpD
MPTSAPPPGAEAIARLADFSAALAYEDLPADVVAKARVHLLDTLGAAFAGTRSREFGQVLATIEPRADGAAGIWGSDLRASVRDAALVNGVAAHVFELDDTGGCDHSGAVVVPALMAAAEGRAVSGREFLTAFVVGYEVGRRVLEASGGYDRHNGAGWHSTGTCGAIAAAAAVARLWRLDAVAMRHAITIATSFGSGLWAFIHDGAQTKKLHAGRAAEGGVLAAQLAAQGMTGPSQVFDEVWGGFFRAHDHAPGDPSRFTADLGSPYKLMRVSLKPYASCRSAHSAVDALADILRDTGRPATDIARIDVRASGLVVDMCGRADISPLAAAQMSLPLAMASLAVHGSAGLPSYAETKRNDPRIADLLSRLSIAIDPAQAAMDEPVVTVTFNDGATAETMVPRATGSPERPMLSDAVKAKFAELAGMRYDAATVAKIAVTVDGLADLPDVAALLALTGAGLPDSDPFR